MKKLQRSDKLALRKEIVRTLNRVELGDVAGGNVTSTVQHTHVFCAGAPNPGA